MSELSSHQNFLRLPCCLHEISCGNPYAKTNEPVRAAVRKRDDMGSLGNDLIGISIDTYGDGRNNVFIGSDTLKQMMVGNLQPGIFYEDSQKIYFLETPSNSFVDEHTYKLNVNVPEKNLNFSAQTDLVNGTGLMFDFLSKITLKSFQCFSSFTFTLSNNLSPLEINVLISSIFLSLIFLDNKLTDA